MCGRAGGVALGQPSLQHWPPHPLSLERFPQVLGQMCNQRNTPLPWSPAQGPQLLGSASLLSGVAAGSLSDCSQAGGPLALPRDLCGLSHTRGHSPPAQGCCWRALLATWCPRSVALAATQHGLVLVPPAGRVLPQGSQVLQVRGTNGPALCSLGICCAPCPGPLPSICLLICACHSPRETRCHLTSPNTWDEPWDPSSLETVSGRAPSSVPALSPGLEPWARERPGLLREGLQGTPGWVLKTQAPTQAYSGSGL